jgi:hypothetical protein
LDVGIRLAFENRNMETVSDLLKMESLQQDVDVRAFLGDTTFPGEIRKEKYIISDDQIIYAQIAVCPLNLRILDLEKRYPKTENVKRKFTQNILHYS